MATKSRKKPAKTVPKKAARKTTAKVASAKVESKPASYPKLPSAWWLTKRSGWLLWEHRRVFGILTLIYGALTIVLVRGLAGGTNVGELKSQLDQAFTGKWGSLVSGLSIFAVLLGSSGNDSSDTAGAYQLFLTLIASLAVIWALRQIHSGNRKLRVRDAYYLGMYPLIPFLLILLVIGLQLIPLLIGSTLYSVVIGNGIAVHLIEKIIWVVVFISLAAISLYWLTSSIFALYIVTLPDMTPMKALRSARGLVKRRRWPILRKLLWLPLALFVVAAIIMLPIILWLTPLAQWVFFFLTMVGLAAVHTYMYVLYRELLHE